MPPRLKKRVLQIGVFVLAGLLLWLSLRGVDFHEMGLTLRKADYKLILPLILVVLFSHYIRAWRWKLLLEALPAKGPGQPAPHVSMQTSFASVMIGYLVNYAASRFGEVARTANLAAREGIAFSSVLGTVVIERILDVIVLFLSLISVAVALSERSEVLNRIFIEPLFERIEQLPVPILLGLVGGFVLLLMVVVLSFRRPGTVLNRFYSTKINPMLHHFTDGMMTVVRSNRKIALVASTLLMWFSYLVMSYIPLRMFGLTQVYHLNLLDAWVIMILGSVGVAIPSPGGVGSYHFFTIQTMVHLFGTEQTAAATYAVFAHAGQMILIIVVGFICLLLQGTSIRSITHLAETKEESPSRVG